MTTTDDKISHSDMRNAHDDHSFGGELMLKQESCNPDLRGGLIKASSI